MRTACEPTSVRAGSGICPLSASGVESGNMPDMEPTTRLAYDTFCATLLAGGGVWPSCVPCVGADGTQGVFSTAFNIEGMESMAEISANLTDRQFHHVLIAGMMAQREAIRNMGGTPLEEVAPEGGGSGN